MINLHKELEGILSSTEDIMLSVKQCHISAFTPTVSVITDANIITLHFSFWYYYFGIRLFSTTYKNIVPYRYVTGTTIKKGNFLSTLEIKTKDIKHSERKGVENSIVIDGLFTEQAEKLAKIIELIIQAYQFPSPMPDPEKISVKKAIEICNAENKKILWLGFEQKESVANMLGIPINLIEPITLSTLLDMSPQEITKFQNSICMDYTTNTTIVAAKVLQLEAQLNCSIIDGGFTNNIIKGKTFVRQSMPIDIRHNRIIPLQHKHSHF
jgi:hypothetical protein